MTLVVEQMEELKDVEVYVSLDGKIGLYLVKLLTGQIIKKEKF